MWWTESQSFYFLDQDVKCLTRREVDLLLEGTKSCSVLSLLYNRIPVDFDANALRRTDKSLTLRCYFRAFSSNPKLRGSNVDGYHGTFRA